MTGLNRFQCDFDSPPPPFFAATLLPFFRPVYCNQRDRARPKLFRRRSGRLGKEHSWQSSVANAELDWRECPWNRPERWLNNLGAAQRNRPARVACCFWLLPPFFSFCACLQPQHSMCWGVSFIVFYFILFITGSHPL